MGEEPSSYNDEEIVGSSLVFCLLVLHWIWYQFCSCKRSAFIWRKTSGTWASSVCYCYRWCSWNLSSFWSNALDSSTWLSWQGWKKLNGFLKSAHIMRCKFERQIDNNSFSFLFSFFFFSVGCNNDCDTACCNCNIEKLPPLCEQCCQEETWDTGMLSGFSRVGITLEILNISYLCWRYYIFLFNCFIMKSLLLKDAFNSPQISPSFMQYSHFTETQLVE